MASEAEAETAAVVTAPPLLSTIYVRWSRNTAAALATTAAAVAMAEL